jgi:TonB family protein
LAPPSLSFSIPDQGGFLARLVDNIKNIGDSFRGGGKVSRAGTGDFQFLLPEESLVDRIVREISTAFRDFTRDPKGFIVQLARGEGSNRFRRNALLAGSEMALAGYVTLYFVSQIVSAVKKGNSPTINFYFIGFAAYLGLCYLTRGFLLYKFINRVTGKLAVPKVALEFANWIPIIAVLFVLVFRPNYNFYCMLFPAKCAPPEEKKEEVSDQLLTMVDTEFKPELKKAAVEKKQIGGSKPKPQAASGGGGGGRQQPTPPSKGVPPQMALTPQIIPPNPEPPKIKNPTLVVASTIYGDPKAIPPMKGPIGDPTGVPAPPSSGPGTGAGIGRGAGTGVGGGQGGGLGPGQGGNVGGGNMGIGGGGGVEPMTASVRPKILYQEKAKYTEEARQNKVQGTVMLSVIFSADGQIQNIRVVRGLPDGLTEKAIEAAKRIRFQPAVKNGQAVSVRGTLEFSFNLY